MVEGARLESVYTGNGIAGSNPALSAFARRSFCVAGLRHNGKSAGSPAGFGGRCPRRSPSAIMTLGFARPAQV